MCSGRRSAIASRRGLPLAVVGGFVVALAWLGERDTAWGFPMLIAGALMLGLGLLGPRLSGSVAMRWGDDGAFIEISSTVAPPGQRRRAPALRDPAPTADEQAPPEKLMPPGEIEGEAETIDFKIEATGASLESDPETGSES